MKKAVRTGLALAFVMAVTMTSCKDKEVETEMETEVSTEIMEDTMMTTADSVSIDTPGTTGGEMEQVP